MTVTWGQAQTHVLRVSALWDRASMGLRTLRSWRKRGLIRHCVINFNGGQRGPPSSEKLEGHEVNMMLSKDE